MRFLIYCLANPNCPSLNNRSIKMKERMLQFKSTALCCLIIYFSTNMYCTDYITFGQTEAFCLLYLVWTQWSAECWNVIQWVGRHLTEHVHRRLLYPAEFIRLLPSAVKSSLNGTVHVPLAAIHKPIIHSINSLLVPWGQFVLEQCNTLSCSRPPPGVQ